MKRKKRVVTDGKITEKNKNKIEKKRDLRATTKDLRRKRRRIARSSGTQFLILFSCFYFLMGMYLMAEMIPFTVLS